MSSDLKHLPVLVDEVISYLKPQSNKIYFDGTFGQGGYSKKILSLNSKVIATDRDSISKNCAKELKLKYPKRFFFKIEKFSNIKDILKQFDVKKVNGVTLDLGLSSPQIDNSSRGFSFNTDGGRCDECKGEGVVRIEMQFMADVELECEICKGKRFKDEITAIKYNGVSIDMLLNMTVDDSIKFFRKYNQTKIVNKLLPLQSVGLGYVSLGQSSNTLSGGEAQRIKLASFIGKGDQVDKTFFIFDEPTTGLHFHDVKKLLNTFDKLIRMGHSILVIEHNLDMISCADHIIDLGPEGGDKGGNIIAEGSPEDIIKNKRSYTGQYLKKK